MIDNYGLDCEKLFFQIYETNINPEIPEYRALYKIADVRVQRSTQLHLAVISMQLNSSFIRKD